jgi:uncharacterized protein (DUF4415 family)
MLQTIKTRSGRTIILPTPEEDAIITAAAMSDPDAIPLTDAEWAAVQPQLRRGRPIAAQTKIHTGLRLDAEVVAAFKAGGRGWQTRMNDALKDWLKTHHTA